MDIKQDKRVPQTILSSNPVTYLSPITDQKKHSIMHNENQHNMSNYDVSSLKKAITDYRKV